MKIKNIMVIGAGLMGRGIAEVAAIAGYSVYWYENNSEIGTKSYTVLKASLSKAVDKGKIDQSDKEKALKNITLVDTLAVAVQADMVIEAITEKISLKTDLFIELDAVCKEHTVFASNTSSLSITELAACTKRADKFIGLHFFSPVPVMKLVEIIKGAGSSEQTCNAAQEVVEAMNKEFIHAPDYPGFLVNRILMVMLNEAFNCVRDGMLPEDIDKGMTLGCNMPMGPLALADFVGLDICYSVLTILYEGYGDTKYKPSPLLKNMVNAGYLGKKTGKGFYTYD
ncbi:MAG: 3-hydroxybutyryl-CoA dehydrogenase [Bacteroidetes bacterium]|nr:3-hydroxybutyryl-CoA dehydrogenase [Bacteroidota bacterium]